MNIGKAVLRLGDDIELDVYQTAEYLFLFRAAYAASLKVLRNQDISHLGDDQSEPRNRLLSLFASLSVNQIKALFVEDLGTNQLITKRLSQESPTEIVLLGVIVAMAAAVILSGGKFKLLDILKAELPPMGEGIAKLREAFTKNTRSGLGYGMTSRVVKLSKEEYEELMRYDPMTRNQGGFQRFLISLQFRINRTSRELELSDSDMEAILRHGNQPKKGGWQRSIRKIFGRHFNFEDDS
jgi:hypothetical protein